MARPKRNKAERIAAPPEQPGRPGGAEFAWIARYFAPLSRGHAGAFGLTDDAAVIAVAPGDELIVTNDTVVAGVHFLADEPPAVVARRVLRVNLSDLAAMGAVPLGYSLSLALPVTLGEDWVAAFAAELGEEQKRFAVNLIGGDSVATPGPATLGVTAYGTAPAGQALRRSTARAGDEVFVSGTVGDAALGLLVARGDLTELDAADRAWLLERYREPQPRLALGHALVGLASAAIDVSDGLVADLGHVAAGSGLAAELRADRVPLSSAARAAIDRDTGLRELVLTGGDDYELVFTAAPERREDVARVAAALSVPLTQVGIMREGAGVTVRDADGRAVPVADPGYRHF